MRCIQRELLLAISLALFGCEGVVDGPDTLLGATGGGVQRATGGGAATGATGGGGGSSTGGEGGGVSGSGGGAGFTFTCTPPTMAEANIDAIATAFEARVFGRLVDAESGCTRCHAPNSSRQFKVSSTARQTFDAAVVAGLFTDGPAGILARLIETNPALRMPQGESAWPAADIQAVADITCRLKHLAQPAVCTPSDIKPGAAPLRRLTRRELGNTVAVVMGITDRPADALLPEDLHAEGWPDNDAELLTAGSAHVRGYSALAEDLSARITATNLATFTKCAAPVTDACARTFLTDDFGLRAFRRPLTAAEKGRYQTLFTQSRAAWSLREAVMVTVEALLQAPPFLYRVEAQAAPTAKPSSYEMASRLSYLFTGAPPDDTLMTLAAADQLQTPATIATQVQRLIADPRAKSVVASFHKQWLGFEDVLNISKNETVYPMWSDTLRPHMLKETELFVDAVFWDPAAKAGDLLTAPYSYMNKPLADFYGVSGPTGAAFVKVTLPPTRTGVLGHSSILATQALEDQTHPVYRGHFVLTRLLGQVLGAPPATDASGNPIDLPPLDPTKTTRERFAAHSSNVACAGCHLKIDPVGFALENFDGTGRWQTEQAGKRIDPSGTAVAPAGIAGPLSGAVDLSARIAQSPEFQRTLLQRWFALSTGRAPGVEDACSLERLDTAFRAAGHNPKALFQLLSTTDAFLYRGTAP
ncbi:MAG: DUF1592 domain-containing protein [Myxococcaceae bacterium]|nr:DUF1592 domain-containing protein [Myxococcaceae bacterium]